MKGYWCPSLIVTRLMMSTTCLVMIASSTDLRGTMMVSGNAVVLRLLLGVCTLSQTPSQQLSPWQAARGHHWYPWQAERAPD